jgi:hypothetical protein
VTRYQMLTREQKDAINAKARERYAATRAECNAKKRAWRAARRDEVNAWMREYQRRNRDHYYEYNAANRFGVSRAEIKAMRARSSVCEICGSAPDPKKRLQIDHDHETGVLRGVLCQGCNLGLGAFKDDIARIHKAALYLARHKCKGEVA